MSVLEKVLKCMDTSALLFSVYIQCILIGANKIFFPSRNGQGSIL